MPRYSYLQIEQKAKEVIEYFQPRVLVTAPPIPVQSFVDLLCKKGHLKFCVTDLGYVNRSSKIMGLFTTEPYNTIYIDNSVVDTVRYNFTLAHELGHFVLHRKLNVRGNIADTSAELFNTPEEDLTERQWAEWQANSFASALLLPQGFLLDVLFEKAEDFGIDFMSIMAQSEVSMHTRSSFERMIEYVANIFDVSKTSVKLRLKKICTF